MQDSVSQIPVERADSTDLSFLEHVEQFADLNFVVSAEIVIHSLDDFKSNDAKYQYQKGVELEKQKEEKSNAPPVNPSPFGGGNIQIPCSPSIGSHPISSKTERN